MTSLLPVAAVAAYAGAPTTPRLEAVFVGMLAVAGLLLVSFAEAVVGLVARCRLLWIDGVLRILTLGALATPLGKPTLRLVPIGWTFVQSFDRPTPAPPRDAGMPSSIRSSSAARC